ncbi:MAG: HDIG domain-containing protein [Tissierellia bacterium]|nr:HDIG domain-containing protein [Tissierellia bacterium]
MEYIPTRSDAEELFLKFNESEALYKHAKQVEVVMKYFANKFEEDEEKWRIIGFLHDLDYEKYPEEHCKKTEEILKENDYPEEYINAMISHGYGICSEIEPKSQMEKILFAIDELTGLINAACLMRPSQSVLDLKISSLNKKFKDKKFAAGVDRDIILKGAEMLGWTKEQLFEETILALQENADEAYLRGNM